MNLAMRSWLVRIIEPQSSRRHVRHDPRLPPLRALALTAGSTSQTTNLGVRSSNLFGRATVDEDGQYCFAVYLSRRRAPVPKTAMARNCVLRLDANPQYRGSLRRSAPARSHRAIRPRQKPWIVPIPGTTKLHRLEENIGAENVVLTPDDLSAIESAASKIEVQGDRYPEALEKLTGR